MLLTRLAIHGRFGLHCFDRGGRPLWSDFFPNGVTTAGGNYLLDAGLRNQTQLANWYIGLISGTGFTALALADTMASHVNWTEFTAYDEATRQAWTPGAAGGMAITNPVRASFTISTNGSLIRGAFLASDNTKGGSSGTLWSTGAIAGNRTMNDGQILRVDYQTLLTGAG